MAYNNIRAPKQKELGKRETLTSFENWRQTLVYTASLDANLAPFLAHGFTWLKQTNANNNRGLQGDAAPIPENQRRTAAQKLISLELLLGHIASYAPVIGRPTIIKNSTSLASIWQALRQHYGFHRTGAHFLDLSSIRLECEERPEDLYQRIYAFVDDNLLTADGGITHHSEVPANEEMGPSLENMVVYLWLHHINPQLPKLIKQRYGTELRTRTVASIKPEISQALDSLLDELHTNEDAKILRSVTRDFKSTRPSASSSFNRQPSAVRSNKLCPICKASGRNANHYLSTCKFLPEGDKKYLTRARHVIGGEDDYDDASDHDSEESSPYQAPHDQEPKPHIIARRVNVKKSPDFKAFYHRHPLKLTLDTGAETNMIKGSVAHYIRADISPSSQTACQADGVTPLAILGETCITVTRDNHKLFLDALVVEELDVDILAGITFMETNHISINPAMHEISIQGALPFKYGTDVTNTRFCSIRKTQVLRAPSTTTTVWPGEYVEIAVPPTLVDAELLVEPRYDTSCGKAPKWIQPDITEAVGRFIRLVNTSKDPQKLAKNEHLCQVIPVAQIEDKDQQDNNTHDSPKLPEQSNGIPLANIKIDPDKIMPESVVREHHSVLEKYSEVFSPDIPGYNGAMGPFTAKVNMGPTLPPQRKGRLPLYARNKLVELQTKFDELEKLGVFQRPEEAGIVAEYVNPSFLVKKPSGGHRLVTAFADVGRYCKPQPGLMPDVDSTLRTIAKWKYIITTDLSKAFYQIPLDKASMKYCGVVTPFQGVRVYTRCAMGMPGSETALEELMCRIFGDLIQEGIVTKLADDLFCGGDNYDELLNNWRRVLQVLQKCNLRLSANKTIICPRSVTILGWIWSSGTLTASPHRLSTLITCKQPDTVRALRSFIGAYKTLGRVLPNCAQLMGPLEDGIVNLKSQEKVPWSESLQEAFLQAQKSLSTHQSIVLPRPSDQLWIITDGSVKQHGIGATLYVTRNNSLKVAGFYSAKLRQHQVKWLPCEIEALGIAAAIKHFSPYIIQSDLLTCVLTDSKPCVQAIQKLYRGEFSASPRVTTLLTTASRFQVDIRHLSGAVNIPSDFSSRNAPTCEEPKCQICTFIFQAEESVVYKICVDDIAKGLGRLPFTSRAAWRSTQIDDPDLRRVHAYLSQGTRPSKKLTNINDVKRYLNKVSISRDGLLVVKRPAQLASSSEAIVVPKEVVKGLITALHIKLDHPTKHQMKQVVTRDFYALNLNSAIEDVTDNCHRCAALRPVPSCLVEQSTSDPPDAVGVSFAADVMRRCKQTILVLRENITSYTTSRIIENEQRDTLRSALACLCIEIRPLDGPTTVIRVDPAPGFTSLVNDQTLSDLHIQLEIGRVKNTNKNPIAEKAIAELENELLKQEPGGGPVTSLTLAIATARLNSRIRNRGLSAREMLLQRNQFTNEQLPLNDYDLINQQHEQRTINHPYSEKSKAPKGVVNPSPSLRVGDLVYLYRDRDKNKARDRYIIVSVDGVWCYIRKFTGSQLRASSYKVKLCECYKVPSFKPDLVTPKNDMEEEIDDVIESNGFGVSQHDSEYPVMEGTPSKLPDKETIPPQPPDIPLVLSQPASSDLFPQGGLPNIASDHEYNDPSPASYHSPTCGMGDHSKEPLLGSPRPIRKRHLPKHLEEDYVLSYRPK